MRYVSVADENAVVFDEFKVLPVSTGDIILVELQEAVRKLEKKKSGLYR